MPVKSAGELRAVAERVLRNAGADEAAAARVAQGLISSNLAGHDSHGAQLLLAYANAIREGQVVPTARPELARETRNTALVKGNWGFGHVSAKYALDIAVEKALKERLAWVNLVEANHTGRVGEYVEMAVDRGVAALITVGGAGEETPMAVPFGGRDALLATNPIAFGFPGGDEPPLIADFATTTIAGGKVLLARNRGETLPEDCIVDRHGAPSTNPDDYYDGGALVSFGGYKGYAIALLVEFLGRILGASDDFAETERGGPMFRRGASFRHSGMSIFAIDPSTFGGDTAAAAKSGEFLNKVRASRPAEGVEQVMAPGDPERKTRRAREAQGIPVSDEVWQGIIDLLEDPTRRPDVP